MLNHVDRVLAAALDACPTHPIALYNMGCLRLAQGDSTKAADLCQQAQPLLTDIHGGMAAAQRLADLAVAQDPTLLDADARQAAAHVQQQLREYADLRPDFLEQVPPRPGSPPSRRVLRAARGPALAPTRTYLHAQPSPCPLLPAPPTSVWLWQMDRLRATLRACGPGDQLCLVARGHHSRGRGEQADAAFNVAMAARPRRAPQNRHPGRERAGGAGWNGQGGVGWVAPRVGECRRRRARGRDSERGAGGLTQERRTPPCSREKNATCLSLPNR
jgi:hypothetical protein